MQKKRFKNHGVKLPEIEISKEDYVTFGVKEGTSNVDFLRKVILTGLESKIADGYIAESDKPIYIERIKNELSVIKKGGFTDYILLVWDFINFCKKNNIATGMGRGSAAGSLILYLIGVTNVIDPIKHGLYFERFISEARIKKIVVDGEEYLDGSLLPDVDTDIAHDDRHKVIEYMSNKYKGKFCKLATFSTLTSKICIKDTLKIAMGASEEEARDVSDCVETIFGKTDTLQKTYEKSEKFRKFADANPKVYNIAKKLENLIKTTSSHASGYLVTHFDLDECIPTRLTKNNEGEVELVSLYESKDASNIAVKVDLLGLRDLTLVNDLVKNLNIDINKLNFNDPEIYKYLEESNLPYGLFQIGAPSVFSALKKIKPKNFEDLSAVLAIARPGCMKFVDQYATFTRTGESEKYDKYLDKIFGSTANVPLYQEQLMRCAHEIFGLSLVEAEGVRRCASKKMKDEMEIYKEKIYSQAEKLNLPKETADKFCQILLDSADYSFNKCLCPETLVECLSGEKKRLNQIKAGDLVLAYDVDNKKDHYVKVVDVHSNMVELFEVEFDDGGKIKCSLDHKFLTSSGKMMPLKDILLSGELILSKGFSFIKIKSTKSIGVKCTLDLEVDHKDHNFYAEDVVTSNSHSCSYSGLSFLTAYLKYHYPTEFFLASLKGISEKSDSSNSISSVQKEMFAAGIQLLPPDIFKSQIDFSIEGSDIRYGLKAIKGISDTTFEKIISLAGTKRDKKVKIFSVCKELKMPITVLTALIQVGAFDSMSSNRRKMSYEARLFYLLTTREQKWCEDNIDLINDSIFTFLKDYQKWCDPISLKRIISDSRIETIRKKAEPAQKIYRNHEEQYKTAQYICERLLLGYTHSFTLHEIMKDKTRNKLEKLYNATPDRIDKGFIYCAAYVKDVAVKTAKSSGKEYLYLLIEDETAEREVKAFKQDLDTLTKNNNIPEIGDLVIIKLTSWSDMLVCKGMDVTRTEVFMKPSDLKKVQKTLDNNA